MSKLTHHEERIAAVVITIVGIVGIIVALHVSQQHYNDREAYCARHPSQGLTAHVCRFTPDGEVQAVH